MQTVVVTGGDLPPKCTTLRAIYIYIYVTESEFFFVFSFFSRKFYALRWKERICSCYEHCDEYLKTLSLSFSLLSYRFAIVSCVCCTYVENVRR